MTLIVGIRCSDGMVVAADGASTFGGIGTKTIQQRTSKKLSILHGKIIVGVSGPVGLGQRFKAYVEDGYSKNSFKGRAEEAMQIMRNGLWDIVRPEYEVARIAAGVVGPAISQSPVLSSMIVAMPFGRKTELLNFDHQCSPELATDNLPFVSVGSGQSIADPFLSFQRKVLWPKEVPTLQDGIFSAIWTLRHAIDSSPGGVAEPIQVCTLSQVDGRDLVARELEEEEIRQHYEAIVSAEGALVNWRKGFSDPSGAPAPPIA